MRTFKAPQHFFVKIALNKLFATNDKFAFSLMAFIHLYHSTFFYSNIFWYVIHTLFFYHFSRSIFSVTNAQAYFTFFFCFHSIFSTYNTRVFWPLFQNRYLLVQKEVWFPLLGRVPYMTVKAFSCEFLRIISHVDAVGDMRSTHPCFNFDGQVSTHATKRSSKGAWNTELMRFVLFPDTKIPWWPSMHTWWEELIRTWD